MLLELEKETMNMLKDFQTAISELEELVIKQQAPAPPVPQAPHIILVMQPLLVILQQPLIITVPIGMLQDNNFMYSIQNRTVPRTEQCPAQYHPTEPRTEQ
jgi:hypothetical protein